MSPAPPSSFQSLQLNGASNGSAQYPSYDASASPQTFEDFLQRAHEVAELLALDIVERERDNVVPYKQVQLLKDSGLVTALGPKEYGGGGLTFEEGYRLQRAVAAGDGSLGQL